jgi:serine/threonine protein phosphatase PrpC
MMDGESLSLPYEYAVAGRALAGERHSGDSALVQPTARGVLAAVVDGLGHGAEAAAAAAAAIETLRKRSGEPVADLMRHCHESLRGTRGAALALASVEAADNTLTWCGVGNIEAIVLTDPQRPPRRNLALTNRAGVVGYRVPDVTATPVPIFPGDLLIMATDGIDSRFVTEVSPWGKPDRLARSILEGHGKTTDDQLVMVLRWLGPAATAGAAIAR